MGSWAAMMIIRQLLIALLCDTIIDYIAHTMIGYVFM